MSQFLIWILRLHLAAYALNYFDDYFIIIIIINVKLVIYNNNNNNNNNSNNNNNNDFLCANIHKVHAQSGDIYILFKMYVMWPKFNFVEIKGK